MNSFLEFQILILIMDRFLEFQIQILIILKAIKFAKICSILFVSLFICILIFFRPLGKQSPPRMYGRVLLSLTDSDPYPGLYCWQLLPNRYKSSPQNISY